MSELISRHSSLDHADIDWLHLLVGDWQAISDLAFADLVLWLPADDGELVAIAHCRPSTGATVHYDDIVGTVATTGRRAQLRAVLEDRRIHREREPRWLGAYAVREEFVPVVRAGRAIGVLVRQTYLGSGRTASRLELNYVEAADGLLGMISRGEFPQTDSATGPRRGAPRVGDGLVRLNAEGEVLYASPNALSCFHRLGVYGPLVGESLVEITADLLVQQAPVDESLPVVMMGRAPWRTELESERVSLSVRSLPITEDGRRMGAVLLCRDVTEVRRRERELITKDATIREIHHRVKNNLQTVAALLRLQARRMHVPEARAALEEAMRRVDTIALVHQALSQTLEEEVEFDDMVGRVLRLAADIASADTSVRTLSEGTFGLIHSEDATPLALVLTELVTNAVEHGFPDRATGTVHIRTTRDGSNLTVHIVDDGIGVSPDEGPGAGLGTQIVRTLVENELHGSIEWAANPTGGTDVTVQVVLRDARGHRASARAEAP